MEDATQIIPRLWLGNMRAAQNRRAIQHHGITVVVNCAAELPCSGIPEILYQYRVPVLDNLQSQELVQMTGEIKRMMPIIYWHHQMGHSILVHCAMGAQRSAIVVLAFLCHYYGLSPRQAYDHIKRARPIAFMPRMNFKPSFCALFGPMACAQLP